MDELRVGGAFADRTGAFRLRREERFGVRLFGSYLTQVLQHELESNDCDGDGQTTIYIYKVERMFVSRIDQASELAQLLRSTTEDLRALESIQDRTMIPLERIA